MGTRLDMPLKADKTGKYRIAFWWGLFEQVPTRNAYISSLGAPVPCTQDMAQGILVAVPFFRLNAS
jgi:hypothetical protein